MTPTWLYTIRAGHSVRVPIDLAAVRRDRMWAVDMELAEPYDEPPSRVTTPRRCPICHRDCTKHNAAAGNVV